MDDRQVRSFAGRMARAGLGRFAGLPRPMWALFGIQVIIRGGDFVFPFLTLFLTRKLGLDGAAAGRWVTLTVLSGILGTVLAGKCSDHWGRKRVLGGCMAGAALLTGACGFLPPSMLIPKVLALACFFQGAMKPTLSAMVMDLCPADQRREGFALSYLGVNLGVAAGPMLAGFLFEHHLPWTFFANTLFLALAFGVLRLWVPARRPEPEGPVPISERPAQQGTLRAFLARPALAAYALISLGVSFAYTQTGFGLTLYTSSLFGAHGAPVFGFLMSLNAVVVIASTAILTRLTAGIAGPVVMALGSLLYTAGFGMLAFHLGLRLLAASTFVWTCGEVLLATNAGPYIAAHTPANLRGRFQAVCEALASIGRVLSPLVFGQVIARTGIHLSWLLAALVMLVCTAGFMLLQRWTADRTEASAAALR
jgi:MFS family permease